MWNEWRRVGVRSLAGSPPPGAPQPPTLPGSFDAVAACFFLDTAHNVLRYLEVVWLVLKVGVWSSWMRCVGSRQYSCCLFNLSPCPYHLPLRAAAQPGGFFVNLGPLLYHWADAHTYLAAAAAAAGGGGEGDPPGSGGGGGGGGDGLLASLELTLEEVLAAAQQVEGGYLIP